MPLNIDFLQILLHLLNFTLLFAGLYFLLYKPVKQFMQKREDHYKEMQTAADDMLKNAQDSKTEYETKLREIDDEIAAKKRANAIEMEKVRREKTEAAEKEAAKILEDAKAEGRAVRDQIVSGARSQITEMVEEIARKTLISEDESTTFDAFLDAAEKDLSEKEAAAAKAAKASAAAAERAAAKTAEKAATEKTSAEKAATEKTAEEKSAANEAQGNTVSERGASDGKS